MTLQVKIKEKVNVTDNSLCLVNKKKNKEKKTFDS